MEKKQNDSKTKRTETLKPEELIKGIQYHFDDWSEEKGIFESIETFDNGYKVIFKPIPGTKNYVKTNGMICFRHITNGAEPEPIFYKIKKQ